jgi:2'-5' RNA ligase
MRTFIALELTDEVKSELSRAQGALKEAGADVKWVKTENIHLTLKFLGNIDDDKLEQIKKALDEIAGAFRPFEASLFKLGAFPTLDRPRVIWAGIDKGCAETEAIAKSVEESLEKLGFPKEDRSYSAHLTIGLVKSGKIKAALKEKLLKFSVEPRAWPVDNITLFQSTLTPKGPIYTPLYLAKLKGM